MLREEGLLGNSVLCKDGHTKATLPHMFSDFQSASRPGRRVGGAWPDRIAQGPVWGCFSSGRALKPVRVWGTCATAREGRVIASDVFCCLCLTLYAVTEFYVFIRSPRCYTSQGAVCF
ncbi:hypothetical protein Pcinc_017270 [Petrolisthes cinctipes]|uniref:Uncharacterized protein n=1 Tax=Petrolisthes cinctipes TaxID=88211 RepID=A0AAE1FUH1_PETCI|nr:hypothetical protein Pcinc_017270 [Petrolisthes cinctipes]